MLNDGKDMQSAPSASPDYKARFETMVYMIGEISNALGIPDDEASCANGNDLILSAIAKLRAPAPAAQAHAWIVVKEHAWEHGDGQRPTLAYLWPSEFEQEVFPSFKAAIKFIHDGDWPIGFVAMRIGVPAAQQSATPVEPATPQPSAKALTNAKDWLLDVMGDWDFTIPAGAFDKIVARIVTEQPSEDKRDLYAAGWAQCAKWADRADLIADIGSTAYERDKRAAMCGSREGA